MFDLQKIADQLRVHAEAHVDCATGQAELIAIADQLAAQEPSAAAEPVKGDTLGFGLSSIGRDGGHYERRADTYAPPTPPSAPAGPPWCCEEGERINAVCASCQDSGPVLDAPAGAGEGEPLTDAQIIERCNAAGVRWIAPDDDPDGYPGGFDMSSLTEMRKLLSAAPPSHEGEDARDAAVWTVSRKAVALLGECIRHLGPEQHELRERIDALTGATRIDRIDAARAGGSQ